MNYLVFDRNLFNSLRAEEIWSVYYCTKDFSVFDIKGTDLLSYINWTDFRNEFLARKSFLEHPLTILYSFCPFEICGLYASAAFFHEKKISFYISRPQTQNYNPNIINYGDLPPKIIIHSLKKCLVLLSADQISNMAHAWVSVIKEHGNLRLFIENKIMNVPDDYFDADIRYVLQKKGSTELQDVLTDIQLLFRHKYKIGLNSGFIEWRITNMII